MPPYLDITNCLFEYISAWVIWLSVYQIWKDKKINGIHWAQAVFFSLESVWNLNYYFTLGQVFSLMAGVFVCLGNLSWVWLAYFQYRKFTIARRKFTIRHHKFTILSFQF